MDKKERILKWLRLQRPYLNVSAIAVETGIANLKNIIDERPDSRGYVPMLPDKHVPTLEGFIKGHCKY